MKSIYLLLGILALAPSAFADTPQLYRWTDATGVIHYSDKPPVESATDLQTMDMPAFPVQDPAKLAAQQAQLVAEVQATQKLLQAQLDEEAQAAALRAQQAQLEAQLAAAQQQADSGPRVEPIYVDSAFVPSAYSANLYIHHHSGSGNLHHSRPQPTPPAMTLLRKP